MGNFRIASVDGYGDRDDIALARDKQQEQIKENQAKDLFAIYEAVGNSSIYGTSDSAQGMSEIILQMLETNTYQKLVLKSQIIWDVETISEAVNQACIILGLSSEEFAPIIHDQGNEIDIYLL